VHNLLTNKFEHKQVHPSITLSSPASNMSPFANSPHLWLTSHIRRLSETEQVTKIQAVTRGYLVRRRREKELNADAVILDVMRHMQQPTHTLSLAELMYAMGLDTWATGLPSAADALKNPELTQQRRDAIWHASICLRLTGRGHMVSDLEWADYHERGRALQAAHEAATNPPTLWARFINYLWS
jgi:hypothetical protein